MILAQLSGSSTGAYVLVDIELPHWAVHVGRQVIRRIAERANKAWQRGTPWGWIRPATWGGVTVSVREYGAGRLNLWPVDRAEQPREWTPRDEVWRDVMRDLFVPALAAKAIEAEVVFMPGGAAIVRTETDRLLLSVPVFVAGKPRYRRAAGRRLVA
jgi:hypothetical protein